MTSEPAFISENTAEREHLAAFLNQLTEAELAHPMEAGWTVSAVLTHLAFWDYRALILIEKWKKDGIGPSPIDTDLVNEATRPLCLAVPPRAAVEMVLASAQMIDQAIAELSPEMVVAIDTNGKTVRLNRALHRRTHIEEIKKALGR
jgi:PAS domain-containing protein